MLLSYYLDNNCLIENLVLILNLKFQNKTRQYQINILLISRATLIHVNNSNSVLLNMSLIKKWNKRKFSQSLASFPELQTERNYASDTWMNLRGEWE